jgi:hypothetical protein
MAEKDTLIIEAIEELALAIRNIGHQVEQIDAYMRRHYREYTSYNASMHSNLYTISGKISQLRSLTATNKENAHMLDPREEIEEPVQQQQNYGYAPSPQQQNYYHGAAF